MAIFLRWKFAKGDSNCCIFIPYVAIFCSTQSCTWYYLEKNPAHVPSNQAINTKKQTKLQNKLHTIKKDFIINMKCCIDVISLILYQLVAVMPSQYWHCNVTTHREA